ncbi:MAG: ribose 5-phosphate isomerase B [Candidatus Woesearchaeota archaeon]|jgi:ribose 5-phosphate isomerase B
MTQKIIIGSDHAGHELKEKVKEILEENNLSKEHMTLIVDVSPKNIKTDDYPDFAKQVVKKVLENKDAQGILICATGIGMSITANKFKGIRAALCASEKITIMSRADNDSNILVLAGSEKNSGIKYTDKELKKIVLAFQETKFLGGRHLRRVKKMEK